MNKLSDKDILELHELCNALIDDRLTDAQRQRLYWWLVNSEAARRYYVRIMSLSASLHQYASEMQAEVPVRGESLVRFWRLRWLLGTVSAMIAIVVVLGLFGVVQHIGREKVKTPPAYVARLTGVKDSLWIHTGTALPLGTMFRSGQQIELGHGYAEVTFDSGAQLVLEGPTKLEMVSPWRAILHAGTVKVFVPPEAAGFTVGCSVVEVLDLGTEFSLHVDKSGIADLLVLRGKVEVVPNNGQQLGDIILTQNETRRFTPWGSVSVADAGQKFENIVQPIRFERPRRPLEVVGWSFDDGMSGVFRPKLLGTTADYMRVEVDPELEWMLFDCSANGVFNGALMLNGQLYASARVKGLSECTAKTVMFWVRIPPNAPLASAYAMVAWWATNPKLGSRAIHISWNRNAHEGPIGAVRTDFVGGYALGTTPLRDGRWHHVAIVLVPPDNPDMPMNVKQYVDGRLDGESRPSPLGSGILTEQNTLVSDILWVGCRLGATGPRKARFIGEIDELWIVNGALNPQEIVKVMKSNWLVHEEFAQAQP